MAAASAKTSADVVASATVCDPVKQGDGIKAYATYKIKCTRRTNSKNSNAAPAATEVFRRYSDFCWLHDALQYGFPGVVIPPLPEKQLTGTFEPEFLQNRTRYLQKFVDRCLDHPELRQARILVCFLTTTDPDEFSEIKGAEKVSQGQLIKWLSQTGAAAYKSVAGLAGFSSSSLPTTSDDEVFEDIQRYVAMIEPHIQNTAKFAESIMADHKEMATCHFDLGA
jgi:sorting nexin-1/2